ncbi:MAG TPA: DUF2993 domain-containing protein [Thermosynechococcaceae cyanobacterium]
MLGSLPFTGQGGEQIVSKVVSAAIAALFKQTGKIAATVRAEPVAKLLQGSVDGFDFVGNGLLMYNGLRIEVMELYVQAVAIDFSAVFSGQVKLRRSTQASLRVVLTEDDLTTSFNTPFVVGKLQQLLYHGQPLQFQSTQMSLNPDKSLRIQAQVCLGDAAEPLSLDITARLEVEDRRKIQFVEMTYEGEPEAIELGKALISHVNSLLDLDRFALEGTQLRVDRARIQNQQLVFYGIAQIDQFPTRR